MNQRKTHIRLAGAEYAIEPGAAHLLKLYLDALRTSVDKDTANETMRDIESRIAEMLSDRSSDPQYIITSDDVNAVTNQLGSPTAVAADNAQGVKIVKTPIYKQGAWIGGIIAAAVVIGLSFTLWALQANRVVKNEAQNQSYQQPISKLELELGNGNIDIAPSTDNQISIVRKLRWSDEKPVSREVWTGNTLRVTFDGCDSNTFLLIFHRSCSIDYTIRVPANVMIESHTSSGKTVVRDITGGLHLDASAGEINVYNSTGDLWAHTSSGEIIGVGLKSQKVEADISSGKLDLNFATAPASVKGNVSSGEATVSVPKGTSYAVEADTSSGRRNVDVTQDSSSPHKVELRVSSGSVTVEYTQ